MMYRRALNIKTYIEQSKQQETPPDQPCKQISWTHALKVCFFLAAAHELHHCKYVAAVAVHYLQKENDDFNRSGPSMSTKLVVIYRALCLLLTVGALRPSSATSC